MSKFRQRIGEKFGDSHCTTYAAEFTEMVNLADATAKQTKELIAQLSQHLEMFQVSAKAYRGELVADAANRLAQRLPRSEPYSRTLLAVNESHQKIGLLERKMQKDVNDRVVVPLKNWTTDHYVELKNQRQDLEDKRLQMDAAFNSFNKKETENKKIKHEVAEKAHEDQYAKVTALLKKLPDYWHHHEQCVRLYLTLVRDYHKNAASIIHDFLEKASVGTKSAML